MDLLLIEDDGRLAAMAAEALRAAGHAVRIAATGAQGLALAAERPPDLLILDVMLPGMDGLAVCRQWRRLGRRTPILMLTARDAVADRVRGLDAGADDYLTKPFALAELLARVRALGRRDTWPAARTLRVGDLLLDRDRRVARRGERAIALTPKEFEVLELLMRHRGRVLSREQITSAVWGDDARVASNVVETYVHYLRDKVDRGFPRPLLRTVRGVGYMATE